MSDPTPPGAPGVPTNPVTPVTPVTPATSEPRSPFAVPVVPANFAPTVPGIPSAMTSPFGITQGMMPGVTVPGIPSAMHPVFAPMPVAPMPVAPMPVAAAAVPAVPVGPTGPVLGVRDHYQFAEEAVGQRVQVTILETPRLPVDLPSPSKIDPGLEATRVALEAQLARNAIAGLPYAPPLTTRWFRFSPLELFMEHVLARRLWTVE